MYSRTFETLDDVCEAREELSKFSTQVSRQGVMTGLDLATNGSIEAHIELHIVVIKYCCPKVLSGIIL